jgi:hypothetical protein
MKYYEFDELLVCNHIKIEGFEDLYNKISLYYVPLPFWFHEPDFRNRTVIPWILIPYKEVEIKLKFADFKDLIITGNNYNNEIL